MKRLQPAAVQQQVPSFLPNQGTGRSRDSGTESDVVLNQGTCSAQQQQLLPWGLSAAHYAWLRTPLVMCQSVWLAAAAAAAAGALLLLQ